MTFFQFRRDSFKPNSDKIALLQNRDYMHFTDLFKFLETLQKNNSKEWMDANRRYYYEIRDAHIAWLDQLSLKLAKVDKDYTPTTGKKGINRINNNLMFHPQQTSVQGPFWCRLGSTIQAR